MSACPSQSTGARLRFHPVVLSQVWLLGSTGLTQDTFDHDKEQKSAISGCRLHWIFRVLSSGFFSLFSRFPCSLVRKSPKNMEKIAPFPGGEKVQNPVMSLAVMVFWTQQGKYFEAVFCAPKVLSKWYSFKGAPSHSSHGSGGLLLKVVWRHPECLGFVPLGLLACCGVLLGYTPARKDYVHKSGGGLVFCLLFGLL